MNAIPWYRSPVIVSAIVGLISQLLVLFGIGEAVSEDEIAKVVDGVFQAIALGAGAWTVIARARSKVQPVALTKTSAVEKSVNSHPLVGVLSMLMASLVLVALTGCNVLAVNRAETNEQRAAALLGDFGLYQKASVHIGEDESVPVAVRKAVLDAVIAAKPVADQLDIALRDYRMIRVQFGVGQSTEEKLEIAAANLQNWVRQLSPLIKSLRQNVERSDLP